MNKKSLRKPNICRITKEGDCLWSREKLCCCPEHPPISPVTFRCAAYTKRTAKEIKGELVLQCRPHTTWKVEKKENYTLTKKPETQMVEIIRVRDNYTEVFDLTNPMRPIRTSVLNADLFNSIALDPGDENERKRLLKKAPILSYSEPYEGEVDTEEESKIRNILGI